MFGQDLVAFFIISLIFVFQRKIYGMMEWWNGGMMEKEIEIGKINERKKL